MFTTHNTERNLDLLGVFLRTGLVMIPGWNRWYDFGLPLNPAAEKRNKLIDQGDENRPVTWISGIRFPTHIDDVFYRMLLRTGTYEPANLITMARLLKDDGTMLDIGANKGIFGLLAATLVRPEGRVVLAEASSREVDGLTQILALNQHLTPRISLIDQAVGKEKGTAEMLVADDYNAGLNTLAADFFMDTKIHYRERVSVTTLDHILEIEGLHRVDFIKIDVEGLEHDVMMGGADTLRRHMPDILFECTPTALELSGTSLAALETMVLDLGYTIHAVDNDTADIIPLQRFGDRYSRDYLLSANPVTRYHWQDKGPDNG